MSLNEGAWVAQLVKRLPSGAPRGYVFKKKKKDFTYLSERVLTKAG